MSRLRVPARDDDPPMVYAIGASVKRRSFDAPFGYVLGTLCRPSRNPVLCSHLREIQSPIDGRGNLRILA